VRRFVLLLTVLVLVATACSSDTIGAAGTSEVGGAVPTAVSSEVSITPTRPAFHPDDFEGVLSVPEVRDPVTEGDPLPNGFRQLLGRDDILPYYVPTFVHADDVDWRGEELVLGVFLEGEARAYPIGTLNRREMVIDRHRGIPTLVSW